MAKTLTARVRQTALAQPERTFCYFLEDDGVRAISWAELVADTDRFSAAIAAADTRSGEPVAILLPHHRALYSSFLGSMACGAMPSFLPLPSHKQDPVLYWRDQQALFSRIGVRTVITTAFAAAALRAHLGLENVTVIDADTVLAGPVPAISRDWGHEDGEAIAFLQHSSGTTGLKKGVALSHRAVLSQIDRYAAAIEWSTGDVIVSWLPLYHDMGLVAAFLLPAVCGGTIAAMDAFAWAARPSLQLEAIATYGGTRTWLPNFAFLHLAKQADSDRNWRLGTMKSWVNCSEPCKAEAFDAFLERFGPSGVTSGSLQICYAMAETVFAVSHATAPRRLVVDGTTVLSCGTPLPDTAVRIVRDTGETCGADEIGEVAVAGDSLFDGYHGLPDATAERLRNGWLHTGDLGLVHEGQLYLTGRRDDLIVVCGRNYYAHAIEAVAGDAPEVAPGRIVAFREFNEDTGTHDVVVVAESRGTTQTRLVERAIKQRVQAALGLQVQRVAVVPRGTLVKTTSGKISRRHNAERFGRGAATKDAA